MRILTAAFVAVVAMLVAAARISAQDVNRAAELMANARTAIGAKTLDELKTFSVEASVRRNLAQMQVTSDVEMLLELPDKYVRADQSNGPGIVMMSGMNTGFNGDKPLQPVQGSLGPGGSMMIRMGPGGPLPADGPKPTPEEQERMNQIVVRNAKQELSRLMLGWFAAAHPGVSVQYTFAGEAESPDGKAYVVDATNADGFEARLFIDQQSNLPLMVTYKAPQRQVTTNRGAGGTVTAGIGGAGVRRTEGQLTEEERKKAQDEAHKRTEQMRSQPPVMVDYTIYFDDWRTVDGVRFPHKMRRAMGSETTEEWTINRVRINPKIDPQKFAVKG